MRAHKMSAFSLEMCVLCVGYASSCLTLSLLDCCLIPFHLASLICSLCLFYISLFLPTILCFSALSSPFLPLALFFLLRSINSLFCPGSRSLLPQFPDHFPPFVLAFLFPSLFRTPPHLPPLHETTLNYCASITIK